MRSSHWGNRLAAWLIVSVCLLAIFWTGWWTIELHTEQRVSEYYEGKPEAQKATDDAINECLASSSAYRVQCIREKIAAEEKRDYEARDLHAQEWMAHWAFLMFVAGLIGTITAAVGTVLLYAAWKAARETVVVALADQRPWLKLGVGILGNVYFDGTHVRVVIAWQIENVGRSPAIAVNVQVSGAPFGQDVYGRIKTRDFATGWASRGLSNENITLFPNEKHSGSVSIPLDPRNLPAPFLTMFEDGECMPEIYVVAAYRMSQPSKAMATSACFNLHRKGPSGLGFYIKDLPIPATDFELRRNMLIDETT
jgi:hypothetical protein